MRISDRFWTELERIVTSKVDAALNDGNGQREPLISSLRDLEAVVRAEGGFEQTIQVIASGRRLLGDRSQHRSTDAPFMPGFGRLSAAVDERGVGR